MKYINIKVVGEIRKFTYKRLSAKPLIDFSITIIDITAGKMNNLKEQKQVNKFIIPSCLSSKSKGQIKTFSAEQRGYTYIKR